jgi:RNA polymerase sigma-70 factor (ECF subfamily)
MAIGVANGTVPVEADEESLVRFVKVGYPVLVAALSLVCGDSQAAEDAVQEALAKAILAERRGQQIESLPAWVRVVALNLLRNRWRSLRRELMALRRMKDSQQIAPPDDMGEIALDLQQAIAQLSHRQREVVALHYRLGLSVRETAAAMGVTDGTVKTLLSRARSALAATLGGAGETDD